MRFGRTKGEIQVEKGDFQGDLVFFIRVLRDLDLGWESATPPTHIWERSPKKNVFFILFLKRVHHFFENNLFWDTLIKTAV